MVSSSTGSHFRPSISLIMTLGLSHLQLVLSLRIVSMSTERQCTPRPYTTKLSAVAPGSTRRARFFSSSRSSCPWDTAGSHVLAVTAEEGGIVDGKEHAHRGLVDGYRKFERFGVVVIAYRVTYLETLNTHNGAYLAARHLFGLALPSPSKVIRSLILVFTIVTPSRLASVIAHARPKCAARHPVHGER